MIEARGVIRLRASRFFIRVIKSSLNRRFDVTFALNRGGKFCAVSGFLRYKVRKTDF
jgi:hypothetical protein